MKLDELLGNKELLDDQAVSFGSETFTLGELRGIANERETLRTERESLARERDDFRGKYDTVSQAATKLLAEAGAAAERENQQPAPKSAKDQLRDVLGPLLEEDDGTKALFEDKVFGKALTKVEERALQRAMEKYDALEAKFNGLNEAVTKGFEGMTTAQLSARLESWYGDNRADIPKGQDGKRMTARAVHDFALQHNMVVPGSRLLDYDAALETLTAPQRHEAQMTDAEKRGYEKGLEAGRSQAGRVIPIFGDRSAGGTPGEKISTVGKSQKQIVSEHLARGLAELSQEEAG